MLKNHLNKILNSLLPTAKGYITMTIVSCLLIMSNSVYSQEEIKGCNLDLETLGDRLLADLPAYSNRVIRRAQNLDRSDWQIRYIIAASQPDFQPLPLAERQYTRVIEDQPTQLFFTTLERIYKDQQPVEIQNYHRLFLGSSNQGWQMLRLVSSFGGSDTSQPPAPPRDSNHTAVGQAIRLWIRDCAAKGDNF